MRIDLNKLQNVGDVNGAETSSARAQVNPPIQADLRADRAELSQDQVRVQSLASQVHDLPEVRQEKVTALGTAIQQGRYHVTPEQTAAAILDSMRSAA